MMKQGPGTAGIMLLAGLCFLSGSVALAGETPSRTLVIGVEDLDYLPAYGLDENGQYVGLARQIFDAFAEDRGYAVEYRAYPVSRLYAVFFSGDVDFKYPDSPTWNQAERARLGQTIHYSAPVMAYVDGVSVVPEMANATVSGFTPWAWMERIQTGQVELTENADFTALIRQAIGGRIDGAYANVAVIQHRLENELQQPGALVFNPGLPHSAGNYYLSGIRDAEIIAEFNDWMVEQADWIAALKEDVGAERGTGEVR